MIIVEKYIFSVKTLYILFLTGDVGDKPGISRGCKAEASPQGWGTGGGRGGQPLLFLEFIVP